MEVAVVGCGHVLERHLRALERVDGVEVVALCDREPGRARHAADLHGIPAAFENLDELLARSCPQVVHVLTPPATHEEVSRKAMEAGAHVLVEKPMAEDVVSADAMLEVEQRNGVRLGVCHNFLFEPAVLKARELLARSEVGRIVGIEIFWRVHDPGGRYRETEWIGQLRGGALHEVAPHPVYLLCCFLRDPRLVSAVARGADGAMFDALQVQMADEHAFGTISISLAARPHQVWIRIYGTRQTLFLDLTTNTLARLRQQETNRAQKLVRNLDHAASFAFGTVTNAVRLATGKMAFGHAGLIREYYHRLETGQPPPVTAADGRRVVGILDEIWSAVGTQAEAT